MSHSKIVFAVLISMFVALSFAFGQAEEPSTAAPPEGKRAGKAEKLDLREELKKPTFVFEPDEDLRDPFESPLIKKTPGPRPTTDPSMVRSVNQEERDKHTLMRASDLIKEIREAVTQEEFRDAIRANGELQNLEVKTEEAGPVLATAQTTGNELVEEYVEEVVRELTFEAEEKLAGMVRALVARPVKNGGEDVEAVKAGYVGVKEIVDGAGPIAGERMAHLLQKAEELNTKAQVIEEFRNIPIQVSGLTGIEDNAVAIVNDQVLGPGDVLRREAKESVSVRAVDVQQGKMTFEYKGVAIPYYVVWEESYL